MGWNRLIGKREHEAEKATVQGRSFRMLVDRPTLKSGIAIFDVAGVIVKQKGDDDSGQHSTNMGEIRHAARFADLADRVGPEPDLKCDPPADNQQRR
jgi:hypothetical protein